VGYLCVEMLKYKRHLLLIVIPSGLEAPKRSPFPKEMNTDCRVVDLSFLGVVQVGNTKCGAVYTRIRNSSAKDMRIDLNSFTLILKSTNVSIRAVIGRYPLVDHVGAKFLESEAVFSELIEKAKGAPGENQDVNGMIGIGAHDSIYVWLHPTSEFPIDNSCYISAVGAVVDGSTSTEANILCSVRTVLADIYIKRSLLP